MHWVFVGIFIGLPALLGMFIYPTQKRMAREARRRERFNKKHGVDDEGDFL